MDAADKLRCFENFVRIVGMQDTKNYSPERGLQQLEQLVALARCVQASPDIMDPIEIQRDLALVEDDINNGETITLVELKDNLESDVLPPL